MNGNDEGNAAMSGKPSVATTDLTAGVLSSAAPAMPAADPVLDVMRRRRSIYTIGDSCGLPDEQLIAALENVLHEVPSGWNSQSQRMVILLGDAHRRLWNEITLAALHKVTSGERWPRTQEKIHRFAAGHGTLLLFDDVDVTDGLAKKMPLYADNFTNWANASLGMLEYAEWLELTELGFGASLQHYNPLIDENVRSAFHLPDSWRLAAQMPFGSVGKPADPRADTPLEQRVRVFGSQA